VTGVSRAGPYSVTAHPASRPSWTVTRPVPTDQRQGIKPVVEQGSDTDRMTPQHLTDPFAEAWEGFYTLLKQYSMQEGHTLVPRSHHEGGAELGIWVNTQRATYRKGRMAPDRAARLESLPGWMWDAPKDDWDRALAMIERFAAREGHARVPRDYLVDGFGLGSWVVIQRAKHRRGLLSGERAARLEALPGWEWAPRTGPRTHRRRRLMKVIHRITHPIGEQRRGSPSGAK
jgi:hypothetical protein